MDKYILSFYALRPYEYTVNPPWWAFWKTPQHFSKERWQRFSMTLTDEEGDYLLARQPHTWGAHSPEWTLLFKALACVGPDNVKNLRVENIIWHSNYCPSEYVSTSTSPNEDQP